MTGQEMRCEEEEGQRSYSSSGLGVDLWLHHRNGFLSDVRGVDVKAFRFQLDLGAASTMGAIHPIGF
jgi:hypothetical protein